MKLFLISAIFLLASAGIASAALPNFDINFLSPSYTAGSDIAAYINNFYNFALGISGALAMGMIVYGGIRYATSAGKPDAQSDAKDAIYSALFGVVLLFGSYLILRTVNPRIITLSTVITNPTSCPENQVYCSGTPPSTSKCMKPCPPGPNGAKQVFTSDCRATGINPVCKPFNVTCPSSIMATSACPGAVLLGVPLNSNPGLSIIGRRASDGAPVNIYSGLGLLAGVTDNNLFYKRFYNEDEESIPLHSVVWTYPYYERDDEDKSDARCIIYAWKKPSTSGFLGWGGTNCNPTTLRCQGYEPVEKTDLNQNIKPC